MAPRHNTALVNICKPQFFKVLFPDPFANLMIPRKFHVNLPHKLHKLVTLFTPGGKLWHVETCRTGEDIYFKKGWREFAKAHNLQTGYFVVFRYEGNMIFKVKIFDMTGCLKVHSPASHARNASAYIEMESSSDTEEQTPSKGSHEIKSDIIKKRKLANGQILDIVRREKTSTSQNVLQEKKTTEANCYSATCYFERTLRRYCFSHSFLTVPKAFILENGLLTRQTIYLKRSPSGGRSWPVCFSVRGFRGHLCKGWKEFRDSAGLKEGDRCIFQLVSENCLLVTVIPKESNSTRERKGKAIEGSTSIVALEEKQIQHIKKYSRPTLEWESTVRQYHLTHSYQSLGRTFCFDNKLTSTRVVTLRNLTGKEWNVKFYMHTTEGRLSGRGWTEFSSEYGLKAGDKCIFKLIEKDTLLVRVVKQ